LQADTERYVTLVTCIGVGLSAPFERYLAPGRFDGEIEDLPLVRVKLREGAWYPAVWLGNGKLSIYKK
tara:strand:+ start:10551 stop:10754 length:204 start_codon:yes stop_codon:yes gene_type:complete